MITANLVIMVVNQTPIVLVAVLVILVNVLDRVIKHLQKNKVKVIFYLFNALSFNGRTPVSKTVIPSEGVVWVRIPGGQPLQIFKEVFIWKKEIPLLIIEMFPEEKH